MDVKTQRSIYPFSCFAYNISQRTGVSDTNTRIKEQKDLTITRYFLPTFVSSILFCQSRCNKGISLAT